MLFLPPLCGIGSSGPTWRHIFLLGAWVVGYLAFHAWTLWFKTKPPRRAQYARPAMVYGAVAAGAALITIISAPKLLAWGAALGPLFAVAVGAVWWHAERSLASGFATVLAAGLLYPIAASVGTPAAGQGLGWPGVGMSAADWLAAALLTAYFLGTVLHVKALIRKRHSPGHWVASLIWHLAGWGLVTGLAVSPASFSSALTTIPPLTLWLQVCLWGALTARAFALPAVQRRRGKPLRPSVIGRSEMLATLLVTIALGLVLR